MQTFDLRPLSLGEILDRTFTLYRSHFTLFLGISAIPYLLVLILNVAELFALKPLGLQPGTSAPPDPMQLLGWLAVILALSMVGLVVTLLAFLITQGATVLAVSEIYLGRSITIAESFRRIRAKLGTLLGLFVLVILAVLAGFICFVIPALYIACRLLVCAPAAIIEDAGPRDAFERSFTLTRDNAGRSFLILLLYWALKFAGAFLLVVPFQVAVYLTKNDPSTVVLWSVLAQTGAYITTMLVAPIISVASSIFYYDLRIKKEAFDLQVLVNSLERPMAGTSVANAPTALG